ncbi:HNH endonuclease [Dryocola clanedunensis]
MEKTSPISISLIEASGYEVRRNGDIYSCKRGVILKGYEIDGYIRYGLWIEGRAVNFSGHRLVATKYLSNERRLPEVNHKDLNRKNNSVENLEWVSSKQNVFHSHHGSHSKIDELISAAKEMAKNGICQAEVSVALGVSQSTVSLWTKGVGRSAPRHGDEQKKAALKLRCAGESLSSISEKLGVSVSSIIRWSRQNKQLR